MTESIPADVLRLIDEHVPSVHQLETLLLLRRTADRWWTEDAVAAEIRSSRAAVAKSLADLARHGLLETAGDGRGHRYAPSDALARAVDGLAEAYTTHRVSVIERIYAKPKDELRSFADAFRLRKDD